jgi:hypothetical protein
MLHQCDVVPRMWKVVKNYIELENSFFVHWLYCSSVKHSQTSFGFGAFYVNTYNVHFTFYSIKGYAPMEF